MADHDELIDYEEEDETLQTEVPAKGKDATNGKSAATTNKGSYVGVHSTGFRDFYLKEELTKAINDCGFEHPSEVQQQCIPQAILGSDILCQAKSGMGKTAVFVLTTLNQINIVDGEVSALVMCHTRELAFQINKEYKRFSKFLPGLRTCVFYGGTSVAKDQEILKDKSTRPHIIVGTPGRILGLVRDKHLQLNTVKHFVLDECDKMLDAVDMRRDVQEIFKSTPHRKQVMMYTATLSKEVREICKKFMHDPHEIVVDDETKLTLHGLLQYYTKLTEKEKNKKLNDLLDKLEFNQICIFVKSGTRAKELNKLLNTCNFPSECIHSHMSQDKRLEIFNKFKDFECRIIVCTDIFGRGIDVERVNIVINYDMPDSADSYLHRVGRAGRFGTKGLAITFVSEASDSEILNKVQERFEVNIAELPADLEVGSYMNA